MVPYTISRVPMLRFFGDDDGDKGDDKGDGAGDGTGDGKPDGAKPDGANTDDDDKLGDAGKRALEEERKARRTAERDAKAAKAELDQLRAASMTEQEKAVAAAKAEGKTEALQVANARLVRAEVLQSATGKLADPSDAADLLDLADFEVDDDGNVDRKTIDRAVDDLLKRKPHLAATAKPGRLGGAQGRQGDSGTSPNDWLRQQAGFG